jgi:hypothetical protein
MTTGAEESDKKSAGMTGVRARHDADVTIPAAAPIVRQELRII